MPPGMLKSSARAQEAVMPLCLRIYQQSYQEEQMIYFAGDEQAEK
jgi:hypothetical protein